MTIATSDGRTVWAFRYSSEHDSQSLYFSTRMDALKAHYPDIEEIAGLLDETRVVVSEPLGDLPGAWNEVPESHVASCSPARTSFAPSGPARSEQAAILAVVASGRSRSSRGERAVHGVEGRSDLVCYQVHVRGEQESAVLAF
jgi:hypothetical protein